MTRWQLQWEYARILNGVQYWTPFSAGISDACERAFQTRADVPVTFEYFFRNERQLFQICTHKMMQTNASTDYRALVRRVALPIDEAGPTYL